MPASEPRKKAADRLRGAVEASVAVLDEKKRPAAELAPASSLEDAAVRTTLKRNRSYGDIDLGLIRPDPDQVRRVDTNNESFAELLASVREHGVLEPITVRVIDHDGKVPYQIVTGERRYQAAVRGPSGPRPQALSSPSGSWRTRTVEPSQASRPSPSTPVWACGR
jgi:hypothetical protein